MELTFYFCLATAADEWDCGLYWDNGLAVLINSDKNLEKLKRFRISVIKNIKDTEFKIEIKTDIRFDDF